MWDQTSVGSTGDSAGVRADRVAHAHLAAVDEGEVGGDEGVVGRQLELRLLLLHAVRLGPRLNVLSPDILHVCIVDQNQGRPHTLHAVRLRSRLDVLSHDDVCVCVVGLNMDASLSAAGCGSLCAQPRHPARVDS